jgi:hypothetical protein
MNREDFKQIIKLRSIWKIDRRIGNYRLPNGTMLSEYIQGLVESQMWVDKLAIKENGNLCFCQGGEWSIEKEEFNDYILMPAFKANETCNYEEMKNRIRRLVFEIIQ